MTTTQNCSETTSAAAGNMRKLNLTKKIKRKCQRPGEQVRDLPLGTLWKLAGFMLWTVHLGCVEFCFGFKGMPIHNKKALDKKFKWNSRAPQIVKLKKQAFALGTCKRQPSPSDTEKQIERNGKLNKRDSREP